MLSQTSNNPGQGIMGQARCLPFVTPDCDPGVAPASLPATRKQPARRPVLLDARAHGYDEGKDSCPTGSTEPLS